MFIKNARELTDDYIYTCLRLSKNKILDRVNRRQLYHTISENEAKEIDKSSIIVSEKVMGFVSKDVNPLSRMKFYDKGKDQLCSMKMKEISHLMPLTFTERDVQYICKKI